MMRHPVRLLVTAMIAALGAGAAQAEVTRLVVERREPIAGEFGPAGRYELLSGHYAGELDPKDPKNAIITDLALAPRNARGRVEYSATFALAKPVDMSRASRILIYDTPNRGRGQAVGDAAGHVRLVSGWQGDIPPTAGLQTAALPIARHADGSAVTGPVLVRIVDPPKGAASVPLTAGLIPGSFLSPPATLDTGSARLFRRRSDKASPEPIAADDWAFADCSQAVFPGRPDPRSLCLKGGFDAAYAYELIYTAKGPWVLGIGFAAVRDLNAFLRYAPDSPRTPNPLAGKIRWAIIRGVSQSGNFLRSFIHLGFNQAENGQIVFDGANPQIAARQALLNLRFGVPGGAAGLYEPGSEGALWWGWHEDAARRLGRTSLLARCLHTRTCPKIIETFGASEFWGLRMSPDLVGVEAKADIPLPPNVRRYYVPGVTHGGGVGGFGGAPTPTWRSCALPSNPNSSSEIDRALTAALIDWVTRGKAPPPSRYPRLAAGDLVPPSGGAMGFPAIPGAPAPDGKLNPMLIYDFGPRFRANDVSGIMDDVPPKVVAEAPSLVPRVDADGNELSGVASVQHRVPLGTYLGWNVAASGYYAGASCRFEGGFIPFAITRAQRLAAGDPRPSLEERYGTHDGFVARVRAAAAQMIAEGFLSPDDAVRIVAQAQASAVLAVP
jgi:hypothetical protein